MMAHVRWMTRGDLVEVMTIPSGGGGVWEKEMLVECLRHGDTIGLVAEVGEQVVGFEIYRLHTGYIEIIDLGVHPQWQGRGVGRQLVERLVGKLAPGKRERLMMEVRETNLGGQLFLRSCGFRAVGVERGDEDLGIETAYTFTRGMSVVTIDTGCEEGIR